MNHHIYHIGQYVWGGAAERLVDRTTACGIIVTFRITVLAYVGSPSVHAFQADSQRR